MDAANVIQQTNQSQAVVGLAAREWDAATGLNYVGQSGAATRADEGCRFLDSRRKAKAAILIDALPEAVGQWRP